ncbi:MULTISPECIES: hypothetical protein [unclassified Nocardiopsis]|uniref:hypothetical protein n=1 Tax=Nocardiopsis TaxID=2013 RepID=UPI00387ADBA7
MENTTTRPAPAETPRLPVLGMVVAGLAIAAMAAVSRTAWPELAEMVHGGRYNLDGSPNMVPRWLLAGAVPFTTALVAAILSVVPTLGERLQSGLNLPVRQTARGTTRAMNALLVLLSLFLLVAHSITVFNGAGWDLPTTKIAGVSVGLLLIGAALVVLATTSAPSGGRDTALHRWWADARRPMTVAIVAVGVVQIAVALLVENGLVVGSVSLLLLPAMLPALALPLLRGRRRG